MKSYKNVTECKFYGKAYGVQSKSVWLRKILVVIAKFYLLPSIKMISFTISHTIFRLKYCNPIVKPYERSAHSKGSFIAAIV